MVEQMADSQSGSENRAGKRNPPEESARFRPRRARWIAVVCAVFLLAVCTVMAAFLQRSDTGVHFRVSDQVALVGVGVILAGAVLLLARPRVDADSQGVRVRNVLFTQRFGWGDVLAVSFPDGASFARLELPADEYYSVLAVQALDRQHAVDAVRTLRRLHKRAHAAYRQQGPPTGESGQTGETGVTDGGTQPE